MATMAPTDARGAPTGRKRASAEQHIWKDDAANIQNGSTFDNITARELTRALKGKWSHGSGESCCPAHDDRKPSLSINERDGLLLVYCHAGCPQAAVIAALRAKGLWRNGSSSFETKDRTCDDRSRLALSIWREAEPAEGTVCQEYLAERGILIRLPDDLRFHPSLTLHGIATPALVAAISDPEGRFMGIQRIFLERHPWGVEKVERLGLGPAKGGAVHLTPPARRLQITESVEDGLALLAMTGRATWAVPGASFMASFDPPEGTAEVILAPDNDEAGLEAIEKAAPRLADLGNEVRTMLPPGDGADWCDALEIWDERAAIIAEGCDLDKSEADRLAWEAIQ